MVTELYSIRLARTGDLASLRVLEHAASQMFLATAYPEIADETPTTIAEFTRWLDSESLFVAVDSDDNPVGYAIAHEMGGDTYLHEIDVHPDHGRQGIGRRLIEFVRSWAAERGFQRLVLSTFSDVPWNAPYYARLGFRELSVDEISNELVAIRGHEKSVRLNISMRVFMVSPVKQPN